MTGTNFSSWYRTDEGSFYSEAFYNGVGNYVLAATGANYPTNNTLTRILGTGNFAVVASGSVQANMSPTAPTTNTFAKVAGTYKTNDFAVSLNGATPLTDTSGTVPDGLIALDIGSANSGTVLNGTIKKLAYYPLRLTNAELQGLTTV
jgi:hypothetical protein